MSGLFDRVQISAKTSIQVSKLKITFYEGTLGLVCGGTHECACIPIDACILTVSLLLCLSLSTVYTFD